MLFMEFGNSDSKTIILLHGGGLSDWSLNALTELLKEDYHIVTPIIDGHGDDGENTFISIEDSAKKLIEYIDSEFSGKVFALGGLSIGAQIVAEVLSERRDIAEYAIIESALVLPIKGVNAMIPLYKMVYGLIKHRWFSKMQAKSLSVPEELFEFYYQDSLKMSKQSLINLTLSNGNYSMKKSISETKAKVLVMVGEKEIGIMRKSASILHETIPHSKLYIAPKMGHGEMSLRYPQRYKEKFYSLLEN
jgi:pimeloyl-ACP methyl ester carboxylesterase